MATNFEPHECVNFVQSKKIGTHKNKSIHSIYDYNLQLDRDGLHDLNIQADWQSKGGTYWVRYIHVEILGYLGNAPGSSQPIKVGDKVRVKPSVTMPTYKWGSVTHRSIGTVTGKLRVIVTYSYFEIRLFDSPFRLISLLVVLMWAI